MVAGLAFMTEDIIERMPWTEVEKQIGLKIVRDAEREKSRGLRLLDEFTYWLFLFLIVIGNVIVAIMLIPFLVIMVSWQVYLAVVVVGVLFGALLLYLLHALSGLHHESRIYWWLFIPVLAIINISVTARLSNAFAVAINVPSGVHNPWLVGVTYVVFFMLPYVWWKSRRTNFI